MSLSTVPHKKHIKAINYESEEPGFRPIRRLVPSYMSQTNSFENRPKGRRHVELVSSSEMPPSPPRPQRRPPPPPADVVAESAFRPSRRLFPERKLSNVSFTWNSEQVPPRVRPLDVEKFNALCSSTVQSFVSTRSARQSLLVRERGTPDLLSWR